MLSYANKTKGTMTLKHCVVHKHHTFILGGDKVNKEALCTGGTQHPLGERNDFHFHTAQC